MFLALLSGLVVISHAAEKTCLSEGISKVTQKVTDVCVLSSQIESCKGDLARAQTDLERVQATPMMITRDNKSATLFSSSAHSGSYDNLLTHARMSFGDADDSKMFFRATMPNVPDALKGLFPMRVDSNDELGHLIALARIVGGVPTLHSILNETKTPTITPTSAPTDVYKPFLDVTRKTVGGVSQIDSRNNGLLNGRVMKFVKLEAETEVKMTYADNLRTIDLPCFWTIKVDGKDCALPITNAKHSSNIGGNDHENSAIVGKCPNLAKGEHTITVAVRNYENAQKTADCYTGWDGNGGKDAWFLEAAEINPEYEHLTTKMMPLNDDRTNSGILNGRTIAFEKQHADSQIRITWQTNLRAHGPDRSVHCEWEILIDGKSCTNPTKLHVSIHSHKGEYDQIPAEVVGWCKGLAKGQHNLSVKVIGHSVNADCATGWNTSDYWEVWEPLPEEQALVTYSQISSTNKGDDALKDLYKMTFNKKSSGSNVRILYYDNFRTVSNNSAQWCRWEIKIDGKSCTVPLANTVHTMTNENDHHPGTIIGECPGLAAGNRVLTIALTRMSDKADCYTTWLSHNLIEIQEDRT